MKLGKYDLDIEEFEITTHTGNHPSRGDGDVYCSDIEYVRCSLGYGATCDFKVAMKQWKRLTCPPMNETIMLLTMHSPSTFPGSDTRWSNVDNNRLSNDKSLFLGGDFRNKIHSERCWFTIASPQI